jgi:uncharacterized protein DUF2846
MIRLLGWAGFLGMAVIVAGCATGGQKFKEMSSEMAAPPAGMGRIYFYRTSVFGAAVQPEVKLNGEVVGKAVPQGFFYADRPPGDYTVTTRDRGGEEADVHAGRRPTPLCAPGHQPRRPRRSRVR